MNTSVPASSEPTAAQQRPVEISGKAVVIGMVSLGLAMTALLFVYFELHTRPFRPLREAIGREFKHSRPNVEGGQVKGRGPRILRISISVPFDPFENETQAQDVNRRLLDIARQYQDLASYHQIQINLIQFVPERDARRRTFDWPGAAASQPQ